VEKGDSSINDIITYEAATIMGKLCSKPGYPRKLLQDFVEERTYFMNDTVSIVEDTGRRQLTDHNVDLGVLESVCANF